LRFPEAALKRYLDATMMVYDIIFSIFAVALLVALTLFLIKAVSFIKGVRQDIKDIKGEVTGKGNSSNKFQDLDIE